MEQQPLVSIVTPCFNAVRFISRTIESVLSQDYPRLEYIVMDGGSTDGTVAVLERYRDRLRYFSGRDDGPADAINNGLARTEGSIVSWLNSDDTYFPGAIRNAVNGLASAPDAAVVYGEGLWVDEGGLPLGRYPTVSPYTPSMFERECCICQPAAFFRREAFEAIGRLNPRLQLAFDYDLWIRLSRRYPFLAIPETLSTSCMHTSNKSLAERPQMFRENIAVLRKYYRYVPVNWVYGYLSFMRDGRDQYFDPLHHSAGVYIRSLLTGSYYNYRHLWRYWREWLSRFNGGLQLARHRLWAASPLIPADGKSADPRK